MDESDCWQILTLVVITLAKSQMEYNNFLLIQTKLITSHKVLDMFKVNIYQTYRQGLIQRLGMVST